MPPPYDDLRSFLRVLESEHQLLRITRPVRPEPDLGAAGRAAANLDGATAPALLFDNIDGYQDATVALNVHGSWANHALMLGLPKQATVRDQFHELAARWEKFPVPVERRETAPWQEKDRTISGCSPPRCTTSAGMSGPPRTGTRRTGAPGCRS